MRRAVYTDGTPCQLVLTELGNDSLIVSFHDDSGDEDTIGTQRIAIVADWKQTIHDVLALLYRAGEKENTQ